MSESVYLSLSPPDHQTVFRAKEVRRSRSCFRVWNQLSRFQRSLVYLVLSVLLVGCVVWHLGPEEGIKLRSHGTDHERHGHAQGNNKVEPVQVLDSGHHGAEDEDEKHNRAKEEKDDYGEDDDDDDDDDDGDENDDETGQRRQQEGEEGGSNQAGEDIQEEEEEEGGLRPGQRKKTHALPPRDGSIAFSGPQNERQEAVVAAFHHAWDAYRRHAWGYDHLKPISETRHNWFGLGLTIIDSLDTMLIMGLKEEFKEARDWIATKLDLAVNKDVNFFETTIRVLGGLLSTFHLSADGVFLEKAKDIGDRLMGAFRSPSGIPFSDVNLKSTKGHAPKWSSDSSTAEVATVQVEFRDLSRSTGDPSYEEAASRVSDMLHALPKTDGLVPIFINANTGKFRTQSTITMGARGDSYYEYLLKQWIQSGKTSEALKADYLESVEGIQKHLTRRTVPNNLVYVGELLSGGKTFKPKMDELACFLPGTLALGVLHGLPQEHLSFAEELAYTCYLTFARQQTHLAPEITYFNSEKSSKQDFTVKPNDSHYLLRPETIESLWYLYYVTGNKMYQDWGWKIFQGIEKYCKVSSGGYTTIGDVRNALNLRPKDMMETFFLGETLKYLYLLFADRHEVDLEEWVFNTEAHPVPVRSH